MKMKHISVVSENKNENEWNENFELAQQKGFDGSSYRFGHASFSSYLRSGSIFVLRFQNVRGNFPLIV